MIPLWKSPVKLPVELPMELPAAVMHPLQRLPFKCELLVRCLQWMPRRAMPFKSDALLSLNVRKKVITFQKQSKYFKRNLYILKSLNKTPFYGSPLGCQVITAYNLSASLCADSKIFQSIASYCPETCECNDYDYWGCPPTCLRR